MNSLTKTEQKMVEGWYQECGLLWEKIDEEREKDLPSPGFLDKWHARVNVLSKRIDDLNEEVKIREARLVKGYGLRWE